MRWRRLTETCSALIGRNEPPRFRLLAFQRMALGCRSRKAVRWTLVTVASVIAVCTCYLVLSPDPVGDVAEKRSEGARNTGVTTVCDDSSWGQHRMAVIVPFRDRFDEMLEFAPYLHRVLCAQRVRHQIFIINQADHFRYTLIYQVVLSYFVPLHFEHCGSLWLLLWLWPQ